jgi:hypothetical protein
VALVSSFIEEAPFSSAERSVTAGLFAFYEVSEAEHTMASEVSKNSVPGRRATTTQELTRAVVQLMWARRLSRPPNEKLDRADEEELAARLGGKGHGSPEPGDALTRLGRQHERFQRLVTCVEFRAFGGKWARREGLDPESLVPEPGERLTKQRALFAFDVYCQGASLTDIGKVLGGRSRQDVSYWVNRGRRLRSQQTREAQGSSAVNKVRLREVLERLRQDIVNGQRAAMDPQHESPLRHSVEELNALADAYQERPPWFMGP